MVEQGNLIRTESISHPLLVISKNSYNASGFAIVCPVTKLPASDLSYWIELATPVSPQQCGMEPAAFGQSRVADFHVYVQCDNIRLLNLNQRRYSLVGHVAIACLLGVLSRVEAIFDLV